MATTKYEVTYIIKPDVDEDNKKAVVENYDKVIADNGGTMVESKDWGKRRFAYEIDKYLTQLTNLAVCQRLTTLSYVQ